MQLKKMTALMLASMAIVGMTYASVGQRALAHEFVEDESAVFLADIMDARVHLMLAGFNLNNSHAALKHIEHVQMIFDDHMLSEIAEKNERIANDIPASLDNLALMIERGDSRSIIVNQLRDINGLFAEAIGVRIDREHVQDPYVQALVVADLLNRALAAYERAHGIESTGHGHENGHGHEHLEIVDHYAYLASRAFATLAMNTFVMENLAEKGTERARDAQSGLVGLLDAIHHKQPVEDVTVKVHIDVHENLRHGFGLELAGHHSNDHHDENGHHNDNDHSKEHEDKNDHM